MKYLINILLTVLVVSTVFITSCEKEDNTTKEVFISQSKYEDQFFNIDTTLKSRAGGDTVLFLPTYSEDNGLAGDSIRTHRLFNQARIKYTKFVEDLSVVNFGIGNGVIAKNYNATEVFTNDSVATRQIHVAGATAKEFTHYPNLSNNLLVNWHPATVVSLTLVRGEKAVNFYRDQSINIATLDVKYDNQLKFSRIFMPWSKSTNIFNPGHRIN